MHVVLDEMKIPHDYREFDGIAHNLKLLADQVQHGNFAFAARSFKVDLKNSGGVNGPVFRERLKSK